MEEKINDGVCCLYSDEDFANHITINLFKKKNNLRVSRISATPAKDHSKKKANLRRRTINFDHTDELLNNPSPFDSSFIHNRDRVTSEYKSICTISSGIAEPLITPEKLYLERVNSSVHLDSAKQPNNSDARCTATQVQSHNHCSTIGRTSVPSDDLTSLSWLQSLDMGGVVPHLAAPPTPPASPLSHQSQQQQQQQQGTGDMCGNEQQREKIDYSVDGSVKPPYSYAALIGMAMKENDNKMTLSAIYKWIKEHFVFYKTADQSWQNSIRHNLSLNKCFIKVARSKDEPGKGGFWKLDPEYADALVDGVFKKRRPSRGTAPPTTKTKRKRPFPYSQQMQIQQQVQKQRQKEREELMRQKEQDEAVRSLLQPVQAAYMPPPTDKPPSMAKMYIHQEPLERTLLVDEGGNPLKEDLVWSSILGEDGGTHDECWQLRSQEVITDLTQSGDPSTYQVTASPTPPINSLTSTTNSLLNSFGHRGDGGHTLMHHQEERHSQGARALPSFELSPESLGVEEDLFGSPEYSEASSDGRENLIQSLDLGVGLEGVAHPATSTPSWEAKAEETTSTAVLRAEAEMLLGMEGSQDLIELHDLEGNLTQLTTLEPAAPVIVQRVDQDCQPGQEQQQQQCWSTEQGWEEAKTFSFLEANLDFDKLMDFDVI